MAAKKGRKKALLIIGHKILNAVYIILTTQQPYQAYSVEEFEKQRNQTRIKHLKNELKELGITA